MSIFDARLKHVSSKVWDATDPGFNFPELADNELKVSDLKNRKNVGVAFSGGGTRSAAATLGELRGLSELGLLKSVRYLSCVSGGSWACVPFCYLPDEWPDESFLGQHIDPEDISLESLKKTDHTSFADRIANSVVIDDFLKNAAKFAGDETFGRAIGDVFLDQFGINSAGRFFTHGGKSVNSILRRNPNMEETDFYQMRSSRPFVIVGSTLLRLENKKPRPQKIHFETTPLYVGSRVRHFRAGSGNRHIGGGYIEPFAFDSDEPDDPPNTKKIVRVRLGMKRHRYTLPDVIGASGAAPAEALARLGLKSVGLPEFRHWPVAKPDQSSAREYSFGDGGHLENLGIMPLLMRRVERIVVFVNTKSRLKGGQKGEINDSIPPLFGQTPGFTVNHVFPKTKYERLVNNLKTAKGAGLSVMFRDTYRVRKARHYGIEGGWNVEVLWVYNERVKTWEDKLRPEIRDSIGSGSLGSFPHYKTFFQNPPAVIDLSAKQVNLLAHLSCWNVVNNSEIFKQMLT